jgi:four helix bundle protein
MRDHRTLRAWQEARAVAPGVSAAARDHWRPHASALFHQLQRASLSVQLNIAEGYAYGASPTFGRHLGIAYGSAVETGELLDLMAEAGLLPGVMVRDLQQRNGLTQRLLLGPLKRYRDRPPKH